jgi:hypothetical protein
VYGEYDVIAHLAGNGRAAWFWQTYAWSAGRWHTANHIEQYRNGVTLGGGTVDLDRALKTDYGQWGVDMALTDDDVRKIWSWRVRNETTLTAAQAQAWVTLDTTVELAEQIKAAVAELAARPATLTAEQIAALAAQITPAVLAGVREQLATLPASTVSAFAQELLD